MGIWSNMIKCMRSDLFHTTLKNGDYEVLRSKESEVSMKSGRPVIYNFLISPNTYVNLPNIYGKYCILEFIWTDIPTQKKFIMRTFPINFGDSNFGLKLNFGSLGIGSVADKPIDVLIYWDAVRKEIYIEGINTTLYPEIVNIYQDGL